MPGAPGPQSAALPMSYSSPTRCRVRPPTRDQGTRRVWSDSRGRLWVSKSKAGKVRVHGRPRHARVLGFFSGSTVVSVFDDPLPPMGTRVVGTPLPEPAELAAV